MATIKNKIQIVVLLSIFTVLLRPGSGVCSESVQYQYDELNRLKTATYGDGTVIIYNYNEIGNIVSQTVNKPSMYTITVVQGAGGNITPSTTTVTYHGSETFAITTDSGYHIVDVVVDGVSQGAWSSYTFGNVSANHQITAAFSNTYSISAAKSGTGSGTITSTNIAGINCGSDCSESYVTGTSVSLSAAADSTSNFTGWSGACSGTGSCSVTMNSDISVTASFDLPTLTVSKTGTGLGTVSSSPSGISCGSDCTQDYNKGTSVTLTASADSAWDFVGWSGSCSGTGTTCQLTMSADTSATAEFGCLSQPVKIFGKAYYPTIQAAYNAAVPGDVVQVRSITLTENVNAFRDILVTIDGGFNCHFTSNPDATTIRGQLTVSSGKVVVKNVNIQY